MNKNKSPQNNTTKTYLFQMIGLLIGLIIIIRQVSGKYDAEWLIFLWFFLTVFPLLATVSYKKVGKRVNNWNLLLIYYILLFLALLIVQPLLWNFSGVGYFSFFQYSLWCIIPFEILLFFLIFKRYSSYENSEDIDKSVDPIVQIPNQEQSKKAYQFSPDIVTKTEDLIRKNEIEKAIKMLLEVNPPEPVADNLILLQQQWKDNEERKMQYVITEETAKIAMNRIVQALLSII